MKSFELKPTHENLLNTLANDTIGRNKDVLRFAELVNSVTDCCAIALDGSWGSGKTFFVKQTKMLLDSYNPFIESMSEEDCEMVKSSCKTKREINLEPQVSVYYDAWENDNDSEPVLSLIYSIVNSVNNDFDFSKGTGFLQKAAAILEFFTDKNWQDIIDSFKRTSPFEEIKRDKDIQKEIKEFLDSLLPERGNRLVVFIDELDRCKPSYAVKLLERIKHYFDNDRITFVFSINTLELQHTVKKHYGNDFDACRYLDRFFDIRVSIPKLDISKFYDSINFKNSKYYFDVMCDKVIKKYNFSMREMQKFITLTKMAAFDPTHNSRKYNFTFPDGQAIHFCLHFVVPIMVGLSVSNRSMYESFVRGENYEPLNDFLLDEEFSIYRSLLNSNETYDENQTDKTLVKVEDKIIAIYNALFVTDLNSIHSVNIGEYRFDEGVRNTLFRTVSLLSEFTNLYLETEED